MSLSRFSSSAVAVAVVLTLGACSSSSDDDNTPVTGTDEQTTDTNTETETETGTDTETGTEGGQVALFGPAQYIISECGSLPVSAAVATNSLTAPTPMTVGEPVSGQLVPGSVDQNFHTWQVTLEPGNYHFIADGSTLEEGVSSIGLEFTSLGATTDEDEPLSFGVEGGYDLRSYEYLEIQAAQTLTIKVEAVYDSIHNYTFGIFPNGTAVPSPTIDNCLPITALSVGSPQSIPLDAADTREDDRWYLIDLESGQYQLDASTSSAEATSLGYTFDRFTQFGQSDSEDTITFEVVNGTELSSSDKFEAVLGHAWIRASIVYNDTRTVEFTVSKP